MCICVHNDFKNAWFAREWLTRTIGPRDTELTVSNKSIPSGKSEADDAKHLAYQ